MSTFMNASRRLVSRLASTATHSSKRGMADYHVPKADTSMDHVFGDNSFKLPFNFQPPSMMKTLGMTVAAMGVFGWPVWVYIAEDRKMDEFLAKLEAAKAAKGA